MYSTCCIHVCYPSKSNRWLSEPMILSLEHKLWVCFSYTVCIVHVYVHTCTVHASKSCPPSSSLPPFLPPSLPLSLPSSPLPLLPSPQACGASIKHIETFHGGTHNGTWTCFGYYEQINKFIAYVSHFCTVQRVVQQGLIITQVALLTLEQLFVGIFFLGGSSSQAVCLHPTL